MSTSHSAVWLERVVDSTSITTAAITLEDAGVDPETGRVTYANGLSEVNEVFGVEFIDRGGPPTYVHLNLSDGNSWNESFSVELQEEDMAAFANIIPEEATVTGITVKTAPDKTVYTEGETLDLTGLEVTLLKSDDSSVDVPFENFGDDDIITIKGHGDQLSTTDTAITITHTVSEQSTTQPITVNSQGPILVSDIIIDPVSSEIAQGETIELSLTVNPNNADNKAVEWSVSQEDIISLEPTTGGAIVTGMSPGIVTVTATALDDSGETGQCSVTVIEMPLEPLVSITTGSAVFTYDFEYDGETIGYSGAINEYGLNTTSSSVQIINGNGNESGEANLNSFSFNGDGVVEYEDPSSLFTSFGMTSIDFSGWNPLYPTAVVFRLNGTIDGIIPWEFDITVPLEESDIEVFLDFVLDLFT